ncbi:MAG: hypothetical protein ABI472_08700 [Ginsengibacter sp.]
MEKKSTNSGNSATNDLQDSPHDKKEMQAEITTLDLPDVADIPGQENIVPVSVGELADITASSADEEGNDIFDDDIDEDIDNDPDSNVSASEQEDLEEAANDMPTEDDINLRESALDNTDEDGTQLNEGSFKNDVAGTDLDVPGAEDDDEDEEIGEEDEENNDYSLGGDDHDDIPED